MPDVRSPGLVSVDRLHTHGREPKRDRVCEPTRDRGRAALPPLRQSLEMTCALAPVQHGVALLNRLH